MVQYQYRRALQGPPGFRLSIVKMGLRSFEGTFPGKYSDTPNRSRRNYNTTAFPQRSTFLKCSQKTLNVFKMLPFFLPLPQKPTPLLHLLTPSHSVTHRNTGSQSDRPT